jgi:hypothetical protein
MHRKLFKWSLSIISYLRSVSRTWCFVFKNERFIREDDIVVVQMENCGVNLKKHDMSMAVMIVIQHEMSTRTAYSLL